MPEGSLSLYMDGASGHSVYPDMVTPAKGRDGASTGAQTIDDFNGGITSH